jgi:predicted phosphodiesterase
MTVKTLPVENATRWCFVGDVHGKTMAFIEACAHAVEEGIEVLISVGDFGFFPGHMRSDDFLEMVRGVLAEYGLYLIVIDGNHDNHTALRALALDAGGMSVMGPRARYAPRGHRWLTGGVRFMAAGGAASIDRARRIEGVSWWREEVLSFEEVNRCIDAGSCDVLVTHDCPLGVGRVFFTGRIDPQSESNRAALLAITESARPKVLVHGHYHQRYESLLELSDGDLVEIVGLGKDSDGPDLYWDLSAASVLER